jgi:hypothetical protein
MGRELAAACQGLIGTFSLTTLFCSTAIHVGGLHDDMLALHLKNLVNCHNVMLTGPSPCRQRIQLRKLDVSHIDAWQDAS